MQAWLAAETSRLESEVLLHIVDESFIGARRGSLGHHIWAMSVSEDRHTLIYTLTTGKNVGLELLVQIEDKGKGLLELRVQSNNEPGGILMTWIRHLMQEMNNLEINLMQADFSIVIYK